MLYIYFISLLPIVLLLRHKYCFLYLSILYNNSSAHPCRAVLLNVPLTLFYGVILFLMGSVMYAYFQNENCDPLGAGIVKNGNQVRNWHEI